MSAVIPQIEVRQEAPSSRRYPEPSRFTTGVATVFGGQILCGVFALAIEVCDARLLGPAGKGQVSLCLMLVAIGAAVAGFGGSVPLTLWIAERKKSWDEWLPAVWFWGLLGCAGVSVVWALGYWEWRPAFLRGITPGLAALVFPTIPLCVFFDYLAAILAGMERFRLRAVLALVSQVTELIGILGLFYLWGRTAQIAVIGNLAGLLAAGIVGAALLRECFRNWWRLAPAMGRLRSVLSLGMMGQSSGLAMFFTYRLDVFVVNYFLGPAQVGLYTLGVVIAESLWQVSSAVAVTLFPRTARTADQQSEQFTCAVTRQVFLLMVLMGIALAVLSPVAIPLVFGARFRPSVPVIRWILPGIVALAVGKVMAADLTARGMAKFNVAIAFLSGTVAVSLDFALIPHIGIKGAALASSITYVLQAFLTAYTLKRFLKATWKSLLVPTSAEIVSYRNLWIRLVAAMRPDHLRTDEAAPREL